MLNLKILFPLEEMKTRFLFFLR